jgi:uncharacterized membrane protein
MAVPELFQVRRSDSTLLNMNARASFTQAQHSLRHGLRPEPHLQGDLFMFGIILGTLCLFGLFAVMRRERYRRYGFAYAGGPYGYYGHRRLHRHALRYGGFDFHPYAAGGHGGLGRGETMRGMLTALETTPGQDRVIVSAFETLFERVRETGKGRQAAHAEIARAVASDTLDAHTLQAGLAREGELGAELRAELAAALSRVHEALEPRQRKQLAELIEEGLLARAFGRPL